MRQAFVQGKQEPALLLTPEAGGFRASDCFLMRLPPVSRCDLPPGWQIGRLLWQKAPPGTCLIPYQRLFRNFRWEIVPEEGRTHGGTNR